MQVIERLSNFVTHFGQDLMKHWFVLYTKPQNEKKVALRLQNAGFEIYCPLVKTVKQWSDRKKMLTVPLFRSYIFIAIEPDKRETVFEYPGVVRYLFWLGKPAIVKQHEINAIKDFLNHSKDVKNIRISHFEPGDKVKIINGPFNNHEGAVIRINKNRLILQIETLGMMLQADLHHSQIAKA